jgi:endonuclease/exonuclease/phosphatase family metal-dependent hydrolase
LSPGIHPLFTLDHLFRGLRRVRASSRGPVCVQELHPCSHFGVTLIERRRQARRLLAIARPHTMTTVVLGDFNEWFWPASLRGVLGRELPRFPWPAAAIS